LHLPNLPPGAQAKLVSLNSHGKGELKCDLARIVPVASTIALESRSEMQISQGAESMPMTMAMTTKIDNKSR